MADNAFAAMGWASLLRGMGAGSWRHPLRDLTLIGLSFPVSAGLLICLGELGWPSTGWNLLLCLGFVVWVGRVLAKLDRREQANWLKESISTEMTYRATYTAKLATVCTNDELRRLAGLWDVPESSYEDDEFWETLTDRWCASNPARYPSQDQARAMGLLCACDPTRGHTCERLTGTPNLAEARAALAPLARSKMKPPSLVGRLTLPVGGGTPAQVPGLLGRGTKVFCVCALTAAAVMLVILSIRSR